MQASKESSPKPTHGIARSAGTVGFYTLLSRLAGLVRDTVFSHLFGASHATDAFVIAFQIPNTFRMLVAEGALTVAFLPVLKDVEAREGEAGARRVMRQALAMFPTLTAALTALCMLFADPLVRLYASGFDQVAGKLDLTVRLTRWMFPYLAMVSFVALAMGALNARRRFASSAATPVVFNLVHIVGMVTLSVLIEPPMLGVALGVLLGGAAQVAMQAAALVRAGLWGSPVWRLGREIRRILMLMLPAVLGLAIYQVNILVLRRFSSYLGEGAVTYLYYADRFFQVPLGVFGIAIATASLPALSEAHVKRDRQALVDTYGHSLRLTNFITIPAAIALATLALPIIATVFQHGRFDQLMSENTARGLVGFAVGLVAVAGIRVTAQAFFAVQDTRTPTACSAVGLATNLAFAPLLSMHFGFVGLAYSVSLSAWVQLILELAFLRKRLGRLGLSRTLGSGARVLGAGALMGALTYGAAMLGDWSRGTTPGNLALLGAIVIAGVIAYATAAVLMGSTEARALRDALVRRVRVLRPN